MDGPAPLSHIAFIMDGNGRWATKRRMPREYGHKAGAETFRRIVNYCAEIGIDNVTVYAFSTENWKRPKKEVDAIFDLLCKYIDKYLTELIEKDVKVVFIGEKAGISDTVIEKMKKLEDKTKDLSKRLFIAVNYGGRAEICGAVNKLIAEGKTEITEQDISSKIYTSDAPDPDLIVRTGGEYRLSNFLLWQSAYSELYITDTLWPDMTEADVDLAIEEYKRRNRRFGGV